MNPIPLSSPDSKIYAYACGYCHQVGGGSSVFYFADPPGPIDRLVKSSLRDAEACCLCRTCKTWVGLRGKCDVCDWWYEFGAIWRKIGLGYQSIPCRICHREQSNDNCRANPACADCGDDHGYPPFDLCGACDVERLIGGAR